MDEDDLDAYEQGWIGYLNGVRFEENPYPDEQMDKQWDWDAGWTASEYVHYIDDDE